MQEQISALLKQELEKEAQIKADATEVKEKLDSQQRHAAARSLLTGSWYLARRFIESAHPLNALILRIFRKKEAI